MLIDRFWDKVDAGGENGCWTWLAFKDRMGYGKIRANGDARLAHRVSYELHRGTIPAGMMVCHHCDNPKCVNPDHLFLGCSIDNVTDMHRKGRHAKREQTARLGEDHGRSKLNSADINAIRAAEGVSQRALAKQYGIGQSQVQRILAGESWSHI